MLKVEYIVNSIFGSITWLLSETESNQVWLVDCGDISPIIDRIGEKIIKGVLLTHAHFDHIYGLPELINIYPNCKIYTNEIGRITMANPKLNMSLYHEFPLAIDCPQIINCGDGSVIPLFDNHTARVYATPGHHPSSLTFEVGNGLFTGDSYIPGVKIITNLPGGNKKNAQQSLERIIILAFGKKIYPGHKV